MSDDLIERLRNTKDEGDRHGIWKVLRNPDGPEAADRIASLEAEVSKLRAAISWIEPPYVDDDTNMSELRKRIKFCVAHAAIAHKDDHP